MNRNAAVTLVELTVALAIVALLAGTALHVVADLAQAERAIEGLHGESLSAGRVRDVMAADLGQATFCRETARGFSVRTPVTLDTATLQPRHWLATVEYAVRRIRSRDWLVRVQTPDIGTESLTELVWPDVRAVVLEEIEPTDEDDDPWQEASPVLTVTVDFSGDETFPVTYTFLRE